MGNKPSTRKKTQIKASAQPKVVKDSTATKDSVETESKTTTKGLDLDDVNTVIENDLEKSNAKDFTELNSTFDIGEAFEITIKGKDKEKRISLPKVEPLPESKVLEVLSSIWDINRETLIKSGFEAKHANKMAGCTYSEFMPYLNVVIPDNYEPRNRKAKGMKIKDSADWKLHGVNKEAVNRRMKALMAKGSLIIYRVQGKFHLVPTQSMIKNVDVYKGSIWHINQIKNILYDTLQWNQGTSPYIDLFKESNPLGLTTKQFEKVLALDRKVLQSMWTKSGFDTTKLNEALGITA